MKKLLVLVMLTLLAATGFTGCDKNDGIASTTVNTEPSIIVRTLDIVRNVIEHEFLVNSKEEDGFWTVSMGDTKGYFTYSIGEDQFVMAMYALDKKTKLFRMTSTVKEDGSISSVQETPNEETGELEVGKTLEYKDVEEFKEDFMN